MSGGRRQRLHHHLRYFPLEVQGDRQQEEQRGGQQQGARRVERLLRRHQSKKLASTKKNKTGNLGHTAAIRASRSAAVVQVILVPGALTRGRAAQL